MYWTHRSNSLLVYTKAVPQWLGLKSATSYTSIHTLKGSRVNSQEPKSTHSTARFTWTIEPDTNREILLPSPELNIINGS